MKLYYETIYKSMLVLNCSDLFLEQPDPNFDELSSILEGIIEEVLTKYNLVEVDPDYKSYTYDFQLMSENLTQLEKASSEIQFKLIQDSRFR